MISIPLNIATDILIQTQDDPDVETLCRAIIVPDSNTNNAVIVRSEHRNESLGSYGDVILSPNGKAFSTTITSPTKMTVLISTTPTQPITTIDVNEGRVVTIDIESFVGLCPLPFVPNEGFVWRDLVRYPTYNYVDLSTQTLLPWVSVPKFGHGTFTWTALGTHQDWDEDVPYDVIWIAYSDSGNPYLNSNTSKLLSGGSWSTMFVPVKLDELFNLAVRESKTLISNTWVQRNNSPYYNTSELGMLVKSPLSGDYMVYIFSWQVADIKTWISTPCTITPPLPTDHLLSDISVTNLNDRVIALCRNNSSLYYSDDGGISWNRSNDSLSTLGQFSKVNPINGHNDIHQVVFNSNRQYQFIKHDSTISVVSTIPQLSQTFILIDLVYFQGNWYIGGQTGSGVTHIVKWYKCGRSIEYGSSIFDWVEVPALQGNETSNRKLLPMQG